MHWILIVGMLLLPLSGAAADATASPEVRYPRETATPLGRMVVHAPQIETWEGFERVTGSAAVEVTLVDMGRPALGTIRYQGKTVTDLDQRAVTFYELELTKVSFPQAAAGLSAELASFVRTTLARTQQTMPLDLVLEYLGDDVIPAGTPGLSLAPPKIFYATSDSRLLILDGPPILAPIKDTDLQFAVNTNWDLFFVAAGRTWYLLDGKRWLAMLGKDLTGDWQPIADLPRAFSKLPDTLNWENVRAAMPASPDNSAPPRIFISEVPAELILIDGEPQLEVIADTGISYVTNTKADLFLYEGTYYYLVSGRWFSAAQPGDAWSPVNKLPQSFAGIPPDHPRGDVRVAVAGTDEAKIAVLEAVIPRKAAISRNYVPPITVNYSGGAPQFERIPPTQVLRAVNTQYDVLQFDSRFYLCYNAAWFISATPTGPWKVTEQIPAEIYSIPVDSAAYNVTHVYVYDVDNESVTTGYDSGYFSVYASYGVPYYGTGWYYPPYYYYYGGYPYYYGYPRSYGEGAWYNPANGNYGAGQAVYGPYGGASRVAVYNPETGSYARGRAVWDNDEIARQGIGYNPSTGTGVYTNRYANEDAAWGESLVKRDDKWIYTQSQRDGNTTITDFATSGGATGTLDREASDGKITGSGEINRGGQTGTGETVRTEDGVARKFTGEDGSTGGYVRDSEGDLYAGTDGQVYKREDGNWSKHGEDGWEPVARETGSGRDFGLTQDDFDAARSQGESQGYRQMGSEAARPAMGDDYGSVRNDRGSVPGNNFDRYRQPDSRTNQLDRDYAARSNGYDRYDRTMRSRGAAGGGWSRGGGGRRR